MEHRGIEYQIQGLATAHRWKWTVFATQTKTWTGISNTRADAVLDAERAIDRVPQKIRRARPGEGYIPSHRTPLKFFSAHYLAAELNNRLSGVRKWMTSFR